MKLPLAPFTLTVWQSAPDFDHDFLFTKYVGCEKTRLQVTSEYKIGASAVFQGTICTLDNAV